LRRNFKKNDNNNNNLELKVQDFENNLELTDQYLEQILPDLAKSWCKIL
jgi:hypothetical protein